MSLFEVLSVIGRFTQVGANFTDTVSIGVMDRKRVRHACLLALGGLTLAIASFLLYIFSLRKSARRMLADVNGVIVSSDPTAAFHRLLQAYGRRMTQSGHCTPDYCSYEVEIENRIAVDGDILPNTRMTARFDVVKDKLSLVMLESRTALKHVTSPAVHVQMDVCSDVCDWFVINPWGRESPELANGIVEFGRTTAQDRRRAAMAFNTTCLLRFGGCRTIAELLPTVWQRSNLGTVTCLIPNNTGMAY